MAALLLGRFLRSCRRNHRADAIVVDADGQTATVRRGTAKFPPLCTKSQKQEKLLCPTQARNEAGRAPRGTTKASAGSVQGSREQCREEFATGKNAANSWMGLHAVTQASHCLNEGGTKFSPQTSNKNFNRIRIKLKILAVDMFDKLAL